MAMLIIRREQVKAMEASAQEPFVRRIYQHLRQEFPQETNGFDDGELKATIRRGLATAYHYELETEWDLCRFVTCWVCLGENFDENPEHAWAREILVREDVDPRRKIDQLDYHLFNVIRRT